MNIKAVVTTLEKPLLSQIIGTSRTNMGEELRIYIHKNLMLKRYLFLYIHESNTVSITYKLYQFFKLQPL